jgi:hypothetical protein
VVYKDWKSAEAKLSLLGEVKCQKLCREYGMFVKIYRLDGIANRHLQVESLKEYKRNASAKARRPAQRA